MPRIYSPEGDKLSEHITEALAAVKEAEIDIDQLALAFYRAGQANVASRLWHHAGRLRMATGHLIAAESIRKEISPRRQAALSREASKRREQS